MIRWHHRASLGGQRWLPLVGISPLALLGGCLLLGACAPRAGYLNQLQPSLAPDPPAAAKNSSKPMYLDLIRQMQQQGAYYASLANIDAFRQRYGNPPELRQLQADALRQTGQWDDAAKIYRGLLDSDQAGAAWHGLGLIAAAQRQDSEADRALSKAVQIDPVNVSYLGDLGYQRLQAGEISAAHEPLAKAAELAPDNVKAISNLVLWMLLSGHDAQAMAAMQQANLPQPTRDQVLKLAGELRLAQQAARVATTDTAVASAPPAQAYDNGQAQQPSASAPSVSPRASAVPDSMLERFGSASAPSEAHP